jgi:flagellar hook-associated protein 3 FlgL
VVNSGDPNFGKDWVISFSGSPLSYTADTVPPLSPAPTPAVYSAGSSITLGGLQIAISGAPAAGDKFNVATAKNAGTDVFAAISDVIKALNINTNGGDPKEQAKVLNALSTANRKITNAYDNVLTVRSSVGSRLNELDALAVTGDNRTLTEKSFLSDLRDLDYATAIAEFYQRQTALQASQQTFVRIQQISLFNYL